MTPKERMITALNRGVPDRVPPLNWRFSCPGSWWDGKCSPRKA